MDEWFYALNQANQGPVSQAALAQLLQSGQLPPDNLVWREGMADWLPAHTQAELMGNPTPGGTYHAAPAVLGYGVQDSAYINAGVQMRYAGFWIRFAGAFIDGCALGAVGMVVGAINGMFIGALAGPSGKAQMIAAAFNFIIGQLISWIYFASFLSSTRQASLGMMAVGLRVTDLEGRRISFATATGRHFGSLLSALIIYIGYLMMLWSPRKQTLHDQMAGTLVLTK